MAATHYVSGVSHSHMRQGVIREGRWTIHAGQVLQGISLSTTHLPYTYRGVAHFLMEVARHIVCNPGQDAPGLIHQFQVLHQIARLREHGRACIFLAVRHLLQVTHRGAWQPKPDALTELWQDMVPGTGAAHLWRRLMRASQRDKPINLLSAKALQHGSKW